MRAVFFSYSSLEESDLVEGTQILYQRFYWTSLLEALTSLVDALTHLVSDQITRVMPPIIFTISKHTLVKSMSLAHSLLTDRGEYHELTLIVTTILSWITPPPLNLLTLIIISYDYNKTVKL